MLKYSITNSFIVKQIRHSDSKLLLFGNPWNTFAVTRINYTKFSFQGMCLCEKLLTKVRFIRFTGRPVAVCTELKSQDYKLLSAWYALT